MSTDSAFALGALALLTPRSATRLRVFLLTLSVVDDLFALLVIAIVYTSHVSVVALAVAVALFGVLVGLRHVAVGRRPLSIVTAVALWVAMFKSGIDPVISGLAIGLATGAYPPAREDLERTTALAHAFREQPTGALEILAGQQVSAGYGDQLSPALAPSSASSRLLSWRDPRARGCCRRSRPTSGSSTACTHGPAT